MKRKEEKPVRGWFPKEPSLPLNAETKRPKLSTNRPPTLRERLVGGLGAAGGGLTLMGLVFYFVPAYPKLAVAGLLIVGVPLLSAAFIVRSTYKKGKQPSNSHIC
jgi:hypothetical protein